MSNSIIEQSDPGIVAKETPVRLSDEKLKNMLSRTYERAQKDMSVVKFRNTRFAEQDLEASIIAMRTFIQLQP